MKIYLTVFVLAGSLSLCRLDAQDKSLVNLSSSPFAVMTGVNMDEVSLTDGFWAERFNVCGQAMVPGMWRILSNPDISHAYRNLEIAAGVETGSHAGPPFHDGDFYKWFESLAALYLQTGDENLDSIMDVIIPVITSAQRADGYIHTPVIIEEAGREINHLEFRERLDFETYNMGHLMTAACIHYRATGKRTLLEVAIRAADFLYRFCEKAPKVLAGNAICPSHYMGVTELYRTTGNEKYLELARNLIEIRELVINGTDHNQDRVPFRQQRVVLGHAVRANYLYAGIADLVAETGDTTLLQPLESLWDDLVRHKLYITGGCGALYDGVSPDGTSYSPPDIQQVHQAYGRPFQLPNETAHNESCANIGSVLWSWRMLMLTGEAKYADLIERTLYNAVLPAVSLDGSAYFYTNPLRVSRDLPFVLRWSKQREAYISLCNCCPPNIVRTIAEIGSYFYSISDSGVWMNLYGGSRLQTSLPDGSPLSLEQRTAYPWEGKISIRLDSVPEREFSVCLRIPAWANEAVVTINGKVFNGPLHPGTYADIRRSWKAGDRLDLDLKIRTRLIASHPLVEETLNQVAVQRGPVIYCLESSDIPEISRISDLAIPAGITFGESFTRIGDSRLLVLDGQVHRVSTGDWEGRLYGEVDPGEPEKVMARLIPYFAWGNRGRSEMTVWMRMDY